MTHLCHLTATMSYDLYLYKSGLGKPDVDEASKVIDDDSDSWVKKPYNFEAKTAIEKALLQVDPMLEGFNYEYLAQKQKKSVNEVKHDFLKFELHCAGGGYDIHLEIYDYCVAITVPYTHQREVAKKVFEKLSLYVDTVYNTAGYY